MMNTQSADSDFKPRASYASIHSLIVHKPAALPEHNKPTYGTYTAH